MCIGEICEARIGLKQTERVREEKMWTLRREAMVWI